MIVLIVWLVGAFVAYYKFMKKLPNSQFEKVWFSIFWPLTLLLDIVHFIHNAGNKE